MTLWLLRIGLNIFAGGRSMTKMFIFIAGAIVALAMNFFMRTKSATHRFLPWEKIARRGFVILCAVIFLASLGGTLFIFKSVGADWGDMLIATSDTSYSGTRFLHSHVMKSAFAAITEQVPNLTQNTEKVMDIGVGYLRIMPSFWGPTSSALFILLIISTLFFSASFISRNKGRFASIALFGISIVAVVKNAFDGGILSHETIPALTVLILMNRGRIDWKKALIVPALLHEFAFICIGVAYFTNALAWSDLVQYFTYFIALDLIYLSWLFMCEKKRFSLRPFLLIILGFIFLLPIISWDWTGYLYSRFVPGQGAYLSTYGESRGEFVESIGGLRVYRLGESTKGQTVEEIMAPLGVSTMYMPIQSCIGLGRPQTFPATVVSRTKLSENIEHSLIQSNFNFLDEKNGWQRYFTERTFRTCLPRPMNAFSEMIKEAGGTDAVIIVPFALSKHYPDIRILR